MVKKLVQHGNSLALVIDKPILDLLGWDADTLLEIRTDGRSLTISPAVPPTRRTKSGGPTTKGPTKRQK
jgi:hypothetical protein